MEPTKETGLGSGKPPHIAKIVIPDDENDDPFKASFKAASDDQDKMGTARITFAGLEDDEDDESEKKRKRDASIQAYNDDIAKIEAAEEDEQPEKDKKPNTDHQYFHVKSRGMVDKVNDVVHLTQQQLKDMVTKAVIENGWNEIWIYNTWTKEINQPLTRQARQICLEMIHDPKSPIYGKPMPTFHTDRISSKIDPLTGKYQVEPWAKIPLLQTFHEADMVYRNWADRVNDKLSSLGGIVKSLGFKRGP